MKTFSTKESLRKGWEIVKNHFWFVVGTTAVYFIFNTDFSGSIEGESMPELATSTLVLLIILGLIFFVILWIVRTWVQIGYYRMNLKLLDGVKPPFKELFNNQQPFWRYVGTNILYMLRVLLGFILLIIPGLIWSIKFQFMPILTVDKGLNPVEAMRESARMTEGHKWHLFRFAIAVMGLNLLGLLCLGVGILVTIPVTTLAYLDVYRKLSN